MFRIGFTGSRKGMTATQVLGLCHVLYFERPDEFHHGDCIGADDQAHELAHLLGIPIVIHPPDDSRYRAYKEGQTLLAALPYLDRNRAIVDACDLLVAAPSELREKRRSGTWATLRYAKKVKKTTHTLQP